MERVLEPCEVMDDREQAIGYATADFSGTDARFAEIFVTQFGSNWKGRTIVDLGFGTGQISVAISGRIQGGRFLGIEGSDEMLLAWQNVSAKRLPSPLTEAIVPVKLYLPDSRLRDLAAGGDAVISNSLLHHITRPEDFWNSVGEVGNGKAGVRVLIADLIRPESTAGAEAIVQRVAGNWPKVVQRDFFASLCAAFTVDEVRQQLADGPCRELEVIELDDHHWAAYGFTAGRFSDEGRSLV